MPRMRLAKRKPARPVAANDSERGLRVALGDARNLKGHLVKKLAEVDELIGRLERRVQRKAG